MRLMIVSALALAGLCSLSRGDEDADRARRVRVALALSCGCAEHCDPKVAAVQKAESVWLVRAAAPIEVAPAPKVAKEKKDEAPPAAAKKPCDEGCPNCQKGDLAPPQVMPLPQDGAVLPTVYLKRLDSLIEVYGWRKDGVRLGYYLPRTASDDDIRRKARDLEEWLKKQEEPVAALPATRGVSPAVPFPGARPTTPTTPVTGAGRASIGSSGFSRTGGMYTLAPAAGIGGFTDGCSTYG